MSFARYISGHAIIRAEMERRPDYSWYTAKGGIRADAQGDGKEAVADEKGTSEKGAKTLPGPPRPGCLPRRVLSGRSIFPLA